MSFQFSIARLKTLMRFLRTLKTLHTAQRTIKLRYSSRNCIAISATPIMKP